ncbi:MAG: ABC transporter ATP-binding protein/permease [Firmicutes bacterium]|nr:ABC transporter ATP-binding protein/permease [Bacillota bacterium]
MGRFKQLKPFFKKYWYKYLIGVLCILAVDALQMVNPKILGHITELLKTGETTMDEIVSYIAILLGIALVIAVLRYFWRIYIVGTGRLLENYLRNSLFGHLQSLPLHFFNNHKTGDLMAHATNDILSVRVMFSMGVIAMVDFVFLTSAAVYMMISTIHLKLTLAALSPLLILVLILLKFVKVIQQRFKDSQEAFALLTDCVQENFSGIRVIKSFVQERQELKKFTKVNQHNMDKNIKLARMWSIAFPLVMYIASLSFIITIIYGGILVIDGEIVLGDFVAFNAYLGLLIWPMMALGWVIGIAQRGIASMKRLNVLFDEAPQFDTVSTRNSPRRTPRFSIKGDIRFRKLTFTYPDEDRPALKNISLHIPRGKTFAIVGRTGSGKTTLVNLILRAFDVERGQLLIDGNDVNDISRGDIRNRIGCVPQDNFLFSTTIKENIDFFLEASQPKIENAAKIARVYDDIKGFPQQFETVLGERGVSLSGGQKQRVSIARALIRDPDILILDDSLSAVDTNTEEQILKALHTFMQGRTNIIVAHRISTVKNADEIVVLDEGEIVEQGTHEQLLAAQGLYYDMYQKQLLEEKIEHEE